MQVEPMSPESIHPDENVQHSDPVAEHTHMELLMERFLEAVRKQHPLAQQQLVFKLLKRDLVDHMKWEEAVLFALYDASIGLRSGPTRMLRAEHAEIELLLRALDKNHDEGYELSVIEQLDRFMKEHAKKEVAILYPIIGDQLNRKKRGLEYRQEIA